MRSRRKLWSIIGFAFVSLAMVFGALVGINNIGATKAIETQATDTITYTFTSKSWTATVGGSSANWTSGKDGGGFGNNGIQVTTTYTGANGTSPISFTYVSQVLLTYNTNKSDGEGKVDVQIGSNAATSKNWSHSSGDGRTANYTLAFDYATPQTGKVKITLNTTENSIYLVSCKVTYTAAYSVTYDDNGSTGGSVPTDATEYSSGATVTVKGNTGSLEKEGFIFAGWNTDPDGEGTEYVAGDTFSISADTTLYAQWDEDYSFPPEPSFSVDSLSINKGDTKSFVISVLRGTLNTVKFTTSPSGRVTLKNGSSVIAEGVTSVASGTTVSVVAGSLHGNVTITATCDDVDDEDAHPAAAITVTVVDATEYKLTIDQSHFNTTSYAANNNEKTTNAVCVTDNTKTFAVKWTSYQVMNVSSSIQWQKNAGYIYNSTDLGSIVSVTVTSTAGSYTTHYGTSEEPSSSTTPGASDGFFKTSVGSATGTASKVEVVFRQVASAASSVTLSTDAVSLYTSRTVTLGVTISPSGASQDLIWTSSAPSVATVDDDGVVTGVSAGSAVITAASPDGPSDTCTVTVSALPSISLTSNKAIIWVGETATLTPTAHNFTPDSYTWTNTDPTVASISTGTVTGLKKGTVSITAKAEHNEEEFESNAVSIEVKKASIGLSTSSVSLQYGQSTDVTLELTDFADTPTVTVTSSDSGVATASLSGTTVTITGKNVDSGSATITVAATDGVHAAENQTISVGVSSRIESLPISGSVEAHLIANIDDSPVYVCSDLTTSEDVSDAGIFVFFADGSIMSKATGKYLSNSGSSTTISASDTPVAWAIENSSYLGLIQLGDSSGRFLSLDGSDAFKAYTYNASNLSTYSKVYAYAIMDPYISLGPSSVSGLKGDTDDTLDLSVRNFSATGVSVTYSTDDVVDIDFAVASHGYDVSIEFLEIGTTTATITVSGSGSGDKVVTLDITVLYNPDSLAITNSTISEGTLYVKTGGSSSSGYKTVTATVTDTDDVEHTLTSSELIYEVISGSDYVAVTTGGRIYGKAVGDAVVRFSVKIKPTVYADLNVSSINDYLVSVKTFSVNGGLTATEGDNITTSDVVNERVGNTYFGSTDTIPYDDFKFSYTNDYSTAVVGSSFTFDFEHGEDAGTNGSGLPMKDQTIYAFCTLGSKKLGGFTVRVTKAYVPVSGIDVEDATYNDVTGFWELDVDYDSSVQLVASILPSDTTESKAIEYEFYDSEESEPTISVTSAGMVSVGHNIGETALITATSVADDSIYVIFEITIVRPDETLTIKHDSFSLLKSNIAVGDKLVMICDAASQQFDGISSTSTKYGMGAAFDTTPAREEVLTVCAGSSTGKFSFQMENGNYLSWSSDNSLTSAATVTGNSSWTVTVNSTTGAATITNVSDSNRQLWWNVTSPRFACYTNKTEGDYYKAPKFWIIESDFTMDISDDLFEAACLALDEYIACDDSGIESLIDWDDVEGIFDAAGLDSTTLDNLKNAVADKDGNLVEQFLAKYDYIVWKYTKGGYTLPGDQPEVTDFLDRDPSAPASLIHYVPGPEGTESSPLTMTLWIVLGCGLAGLSAIGVAYGVSKHKRRSERL